MMSNHELLTEQLRTTYRDLFANHNNRPEWAVHKIQSGKTDEIIVPTIPFVGKNYAKQKTKILVYASAETLNDYCYGEGTNRPWLDDNIQAENRHRKCFDESIKEKNMFFPNVHISPMNEGALATAIMYLATIIREIPVEEPRLFYETIAFGNYGKFSIETKYQNELRKKNYLSNEVKTGLEKQNIDYASNFDYLEASKEYVRADIEILKPDCIIMPRIKDKGFLKSIIKPSTEIIEIYQMVARVINNMGEDGRNNPKNIYKPRDVEQLPQAIQEAYGKIKGVSYEKYCYVFDHLDKCYREKYTK